MNEWKKIAPINDLMTKDKIFDPGGDIDEIDAFLDIDISTDIEDGYHDSEGDIIYLESLLFDDLCRWIYFFLTPSVDCPDYEESRARGFVHHSLDLQSLASFYMGIRYPRSY
ncbi:hypothetical protein Tco_0942669 [Tanacetum coccineum]